MTCRKYQYSLLCFSAFTLQIYHTDDWALMASCKTFKKTEMTLSADLEKLGKYFRKREGLQPNANKTEVACFPFSNKSANRELRIQFESKWLTHNTLALHSTEHSLKVHLSKTAEKLNTRNNIIQKLCGTTC